MPKKSRRKEAGKTIIGAAIIVTVSAFSMTYLYNNASGTNNKISMISALITGGAFIVARKLRLA